MPYRPIERSVLDTYFELQPQWIDPPFLRPTVRYANLMRAYTEHLVKTCDTSLAMVTQKKKRNPKWPMSKREMIDEKQNREQLVLF